MSDEITNKPDDLPPIGIRIFPIDEPDLEELERIIPDIVG